MKYFFVLLENVQPVILRLKLFVTTVKKFELFFFFFEKQSGTKVHRVNQNKQNPMNIV